MAHVTSRLYEQEQSTNKERRLTFRRIVKICIYIIFFLVVLTSAVLSKLSLFAMINAYKLHEQVSIARARISLLIPVPRRLLAENVHSPMASSAVHRHGPAVRLNIRAQPSTVHLLH